MNRGRLDKEHVKLIVALRQRKQVLDVSEIGDHRNHGYGIQYERTEDPGMAEPVDRPDEQLRQDEIMKGRDHSL